MSRLFSLVEHIQLNLAFSHLLKEQSAASKWFHFSFAFPSLPRCQFEDLFVFLRSTEYLTGIHIHGREVKGLPYLVSSSLGFFSDPQPLLFIYLSSSFKSSNSSGLNINLSLFHSLLWSLRHQMLTECLSRVIHYVTWRTSKHQWIKQKSSSSQNFIIYCEKQE